MKRATTNQELLDRYVHATMLPPDVAAEIRSHLESLVEDRAAQLGRELTLDEFSAILKQHGHPMAVASRYRDPQARGLISPALFPFYWFTLRAAFTLWVTIRVIVAAFQSQGTATAGSILLYLGRDILIAAFVIASGVTLLFAVWEYLEFKFRYSERWKPESLPPVPACTPQQMRPVARLTGEIVWLLFFAGALFLPQLSWVWGGMGKFSPSDALSAMRLPIWLLALFVFAQSWLNRAHLAAALRPFLRMAFSIAAIALAVWLLRADTLLVPGPNWTPTQAKPLATLNQMLGGVLVLFGVVAGLVFLKELRSSLRKTGRHQPLSSAS